MEQGLFYFIADEFYSIHDKGRALMQNRETVDGVEHGRPCFFALQDNKSPGIFWCIPISSKIHKYEAIYSRKIENQRERGVPNPKCNTICFGDVMGLRRAFLIQNMFPIIDKYIASVYMDRNTHTPVTIEPKTERLVVNNAKDVLRLVNRGHRNLVFSDILATYGDLVAELALQEKVNAPQQSPNDEPRTDRTLSEKLGEAAKKAAAHNAARKKQEHSKDGKAR